MNLNTLCHNVVLEIFPLGQPVSLNLYCDSIEAAIGSVMTQLDQEGKERPVYFISQQLTATQQKLDNHREGSIYHCLGVI